VIVLLEVARRLQMESDVPRQAVHAMPVVPGEINAGGVDAVGVVVNVVAGVDEDSHQGEVESLVRQLCVEKDFEFAGPIEGNARWDLYRSANLFVLPSYSENFGLVVAEALACGVPVITTRATPWDELRTRRCGWWIETGSAAMVSALREATSLNDEDRRAMGHRGRQLIEQKYTWEVAAKQMLAVYGWILGQGSRPDHVISG